MSDKQRSLKQNKYRWGVVVATVLQYINAELEREGSNYRATPDDIDLFIKENALRIAHRIPTSLGEFIITGKLKTRSTKDFEEAMEQVRAYFAQRGIPIAAPNEIDFDTAYADNINRI